ncbi:bacteriohopanetetrol glucosamine biosynthesis glycosyltransferase HpnI [Sphingomonas asaccharolytica]|uniref:bacteriohopanetetrol glucosamine biosynthesis glycosyltransferase HpnI n=1 Tax=Sphingomonas asaccharolytica TaxID=40681 RepID=UPI000830CD0A|nr:bacteriohopanetetrol glucosamine biosynthesis glycosyltransferase HpnI [Sphingomonas asaccharolytica]
MANVPIAIIAGLAWAVLGLSLIGSAYMVAAAITLRSFFSPVAVAARRNDAVTILKPLRGAEPRLADNLATFLEQDHDGPVQLLCGVQRPDDPAIAAVEALRTRFPQARIDLIVDPTSHGANGKIANLINLEPHIVHGVVVLSDSDMTVNPDYLSRLLAALDMPRTGAVTIAYNGRGDAGFWSRIAAAGLSWQFLPGVVFGAAHVLARPCMGSTIAMRRETLAAIGGFAAFADVLADDYAIGEAVAALGLEVTMPPMLVTHASTERSFGELWRHELRWGATVRDVVPIAYAMGVIAIPFPLALLAIPILPLPALVLAGLALLARLSPTIVADRLGGARTAPLWLLPLRDCLTFTVFIASLTVRSVDWRGATLRMAQRGRISAQPELPFR